MFGLDSKTIIMIGMETENWWWCSTITRYTLYWSLNIFICQPLKCISSISNKVNKLQAEDTHSSLIIFKKNEISCNVNMSTAFRPVDYEASISIYCKDKIITLKGLCCNEVSVHKLKAKRSSIIKIFTKVPSGYGVSHKKVFK